MQAIRTKILSATSTKPGRIRAGCKAKFVIVSIHKLENMYSRKMGEGYSHHRAGAQYLIDTLGWQTPDMSEFVGGEYAGDMYWVCVNKVSDRTLVTQPANQTFERV